MPQVEKVLAEKISHILRREISDPRVGFATVTKVSVSPDLSAASVSVSVLGDNPAGAIEALQHAAGYIQRHLSREIHLKRTPVLKFRLDDMTQHAVDLTHLIDRSAGVTEE